MSNPISDKEIIERIQNGDKSGCAACIEKYGPRIYRLALRLMENEADAEDVMQETFLSAFKAIGKFEGRSSLGTWLYRITYNAAMMRLRRPFPPTLSVDQSLDESDPTLPVPQQLYDWCCLPEKDFETSEVRSTLESAISTLSPALRSVFVLRQLEGMSTEETAVSLEVSTDVVKTRLRRARLRLREELSTYFAEKEQVV
ncbi:MAG: RNA polymerase subunit sigma-24 [Chloroflexi bacterium]|nr:MAG: RNA polymerase subunit sigma-24 [Chloroflexota bacterium]